MPVQDLTTTATCRLLYYGQAGVGKRENLRLIHQFVPPESRLAVAAEDPERQIAFKLAQQGQPPRQILVQAVDAGREKYHAAGMTSRPPFDGVVFVVNSGVSHLDRSLAAFESLKLYLDSWGLDLMRIPVVLQYNRIGNEDTIPVDRLESLMNPWGLLSFPACTPKGEGVRETLKAVLGLAVQHLEELARKMPHFDFGEDLPTFGGTASGPVVTQFDYGPPLPGKEVDESTRLRSEQIYKDLKPPLVVPVKIPRHLLAGRSGPIKILLEVEIED